MQNKIKKILTALTVNCPLSILKKKNSTPLSFWRCRSSHKNMGKYYSILKSETLDCNLKILLTKVLVFYLETTHVLWSGPRWSIWKQGYTSYSKWNSALNCFFCLQNYLSPVKKFRMSRDNKSSQRVPSAAPLPGLSSLFKSGRLLFSHHSHWVSRCHVTT